MSDQVVQEHRHLHENLNASSVEIASNQSGGVSVTVKVYHADPNVAAAQAAGLLDSLRAKYPPIKK